MSKHSQARTLLLAAIFPALLVTGCSSGTTQAMQGAASPAPPMESPDMSPSDMSPTQGTPTGGAEARSIVQNFFDALKSGNVDKIVESFSRDAIVAWDGQATAEGTEAIRTLFKDQVKDADKQGSHAIDEARAAGPENAIVRATSKQGEETMRELFVLAREGNQWKISELMTNKTS